MIPQFSEWFLPPRVKTTLKNAYGSLMTAFLPAEIRSLFLRNEIFKDIHAGERCFILATGPSINRQDLRPLSKEICIAVSEFYLHPDVDIICPSYHVEAPNHFPYDYEVIQRSFENYEKLYKKDVTYFFGHTPYKYSRLNFLKRHPEYDSQYFYHLNYGYSLLLNDSNYDKKSQWDLTKRLFGVNSVIFTAIQVAVFMGFSTIYLLGCDHNHLSDVERGRSSHFYPDSKGVTDDRSEWPTTEQLLYSLHTRWGQYRLIQKFLEKTGQEVLNATAGGMLDVFPRVTLEEIIS